MGKKGIYQYISAEQMTEIREQMLKFAQLQLQNMIVAEDMVQEAFLNALENIEKFQRQAAFKTWVFAILQNKIIDFLRQKGRLVLETDLLAKEDEESSNSFFDQDGEWRTEYYPTKWGNVENAAYSDEFWLLFEACLTHLPAQQARVFMMREYLELPAADVCERAGISTANLHTLLYRARLQLQHCLAKKL